MAIPRVRMCPHTSKRSSRGERRVRRRQHASRAGAGPGRRRASRSCRPPRLGRRSHLELLDRGDHARRRAAPGRLARRRRSARRSSGRRRRPVPSAGPLPCRRRPRSAPGRRPASAHRWRTMSGAGLTAMPSSAQTVASMRPAMPRAASVRSVGSRSSVVATAMRQPAARSRSKSAGRSVSGSGKSDRVGRVPGRLERPFRIGLAQAARQQDLARPVAQTGHRRRGQPAAGSARPRSPGRPRASRRGGPRSAAPSRPSGRRPGRPPSRSTSARTR